jgi:hypothetical protein
MTSKTALAAITLLLVPACGQDKPGNVARSGNEATPAAQGGSEAGPAPPAEETAAPATEANTTPVKNAVAAAKSGVRRPPGWAPPNAPGGNSGSAGARARAGLARYVAWHPRESEGGGSFLAEPAVRRAIAANVRDSAIRDFIYHYDGPDAPIAQRRDGRLVAWGCEAHNCGFHNWAVAIAPDGSRAEVCYYHDDDQPDGTATWYLPGGRAVKRAGNCPDE